MADHALADGDFRGRHAPLLGRSGHQHGARGGADFAHGLVESGNGGAATSALQCAAECGIAKALDVGLAGFNHNLAPVGVQFLGDQRGESCVRTLADLGLRTDDSNDVVGADTQEMAAKQRLSAGAAVAGLAAGIEYGARADHGKSKAGTFDEVAAVQVQSGIIAVQVVHGLLRVLQASEAAAR